MFNNLQVLYQVGLRAWLGLRVSKPSISMMIEGELLLDIFVGKSRPSVSVRVYGRVLMFSNFTWLVCLSQTRTV